MAHRYLRYELTNSATPGTETSHYLDISKDLSAINRNMMKQGMCYHIGRITVVSRNTLAFGTFVDQSEIPGVTTFQQNAGFISAAVIPDNWVSRGAWKFARKTWDSMNKKALANVPKSAMGKYSDFKIRGMHAGAPSPTYVIPLDNGGNALQYGDWNYSLYVSPDGTTGADPYFAHFLGGHIGTAGSISSVGIITSYGNTRATVSSTTPTALTDPDDPLANLFDDGTVQDEILVNVKDQNDSPPYDLTNYVGMAGNMQRPQVVAHTTLGTDGRGILNGFAALCGLVELEITSPIANDVYSVLVELKQGSYKGIAAEEL